MKIKDFIVLTKPGIVVGNAFATIGGFFVGSAESVAWRAGAAVLVGSALIIAGSCVVNNYLDRSIDTHMKRTRKRPSVTGAVPVRIGAGYATGLLLVGAALLVWGTNVSTVLLGTAGSVLYILAYGYAKRHTHWGTFVGAFPGAIPPVAGYVAATGRFDQAALLLFVAMFAWQMPHFYAIGIYRQHEYEAAGIPVLPAVKGLSRTVWEMRFYGLAFVVACYLLAHWGHTGFMFGVATVTAGLYWLVPMFSPQWRLHTEDLGRKIFKRSLLVLLTFCFFMSMSHVLL